MRRNLDAVVAQKTVGRYDIHAAYFTLSECTPISKPSPWNKCCGNQIDLGINRLGLLSHRYPNRSP